MEDTERLEQIRHDNKDVGIPKGDGEWLLDRVAALAAEDEALFCTLCKDVDQIKMRVRVDDLEGENAYLRRNLHMVDPCLSDRHGLHGDDVGEPGRRVGMTSTIKALRDAYMDSGGTGVDYDLIDRVNRLIPYVGASLSD